MAEVKNSLIDVAADLIGTGITLDTVVDLASSALSGSTKRAGPPFHGQGAYSTVTPNGSPFSGCR